MNTNLNLNGYNPLAYVGVNPYSPSQFVTNTFSPTPTDYANFIIGAEWLNSTTLQVYKLVKKAGGVSTWVEFTAGSGSVISVPTDSGTANPINGILNIITNNATDNCGSTVLFSAPGPSNTVQLNVTDSSNNTNIGANSGSLSSSGNDLTCLGYHSGSAYSNSESYNVCIGALNTGVATEAGVVRIAAYGPATPPGHTNNTLVGYNAGNLTYTVGSAVSNTFIGAEAGNSITTASGCTLVGNACGTTLTTGLRNTGLGSNSLSASFVSGITTGSDNTALGTDTSWQITTGSRNLSLGSQGGSGLTTSDSDNISIHNSGTSGDTNTMRIGNGTGTGNYQLNKTFISGIRGITTGSNTGIAVLIDTNGQLGTVSSSARFKENIEELPSALKDLMALRPVNFNYKNSSSDVKSIGLIAEEVFKVIPQLVVRDNAGEIETIKYHELCIYLLKALQEQQKQIDSLKKK